MGDTTVRGVSETVAALKRVARALEQVGQVEADRTAQTTADDMRRRAPVDTGRLRSRIDVRQVGDRVLVGPDGVEYAAFVEFGTSDTTAQPFATPAAETTRARMPGDVTAAAKRAVG